MMTLLQRQRGASDDVIHTRHRDALGNSTAEVSGAPAMQQEGEPRGPPSDTLSDTAYELQKPLLHVRPLQQLALLLQRWFLVMHWHLPLLQLFEQQSLSLVQKSLVLPHLQVPLRQTPVQHPISALQSAPDPAHLHRPLFRPLLLLHLSEQH
jgi:hypothetical protein